MGCHPQVAVGKKTPKKIVGILPNISSAFEDEPGADDGPFDPLVIYQPFTFHLK
jgi:hypothetical protein